MGFNFQITISMVIVNNPPMFANAVNTFSLNESPADGASVGSVSVSDESKSIVVHVQLKLSFT